MRVVPKGIDIKFGNSGSLVSNQTVFTLLSLGPMAIRE